MIVYSLLTRLQPSIGRLLIRLPAPLLARSPVLMALAIYPFRDRLPTNLVTWAEWGSKGGRR